MDTAWTVGSPRSFASSPVGADPPAHHLIHSSLSSYSASIPLYKKAMLQYEREKSRRLKKSKKSFRIPGSTPGCKAIFKKYFETQGAKQADKFFRELANLQVIHG
jgi:hypothetical protein